MKKTSLILILFTLAFYLESNANCLECSLPGNGTAESPHTISTIEELQEFFDCSGCWDQGVYIELTDDIDCRDDEYFMPTNRDFYGHFDGKNHTISNFEYSGTQVSGFFSTIRGSGKVINLKLAMINLDVINLESVGGLVGTNMGTIINCFVSGTVIRDCSGDGQEDEPGNFFIGTGGLFGTNIATVQSSHADCNVGGYMNVGGLGGLNVGMVKNSSAKGNVTGEAYIGGLIGANIFFYSGDNIPNESNCPNEDVYIVACYASGEVEGNSNVGGLVGINYCAIINNSYCTGNVTGIGTGSEDIGGFVGSAGSNNISNSYSKGKATGSSNVGGFVGYRSGTTFNCCIYNSSLNSSAAGSGSSSGISGIPTSGFSNPSNFNCLFSNNNNNFWSMGSAGPILLGTTVPTLTEWAAILFIGMLAIVGGIFIWRKVV